MLVALIVAMYLGIRFFFFFCCFFLFSPPPAPDLAHSSWHTGVRGNAMASSSGRVGATEGSSPGRSRPPDPCLDCLHDLLSAAKRLRGCEALPKDLAHQVSTQCREVHRVLEKADGRSLRLLDVLCSRHSGDINDKLNAHLLTLCFKHLEVRKKKKRTGCMLSKQLTLRSRPLLCL